MWVPGGHQWVSSLLVRLHGEFSELIFWCQMRHGQVKNQFNDSMVFLIRRNVRRLSTAARTACRELLLCDALSPEPGPLERYELCFKNDSMLELNFQLKQIVKSGNLHEAQRMFEKMPHRDEISWSTIISGYINGPECHHALDLFLDMWVQPGLRMDPFTISLALKACAVNTNLCLGESLHGYSVKSGLVTSVFVGSALLDMYMKIGKVEQGCQVFDEMTLRNIVSWTAIITGLVNSGYSVEGLDYFYEMQRLKVGYDSYSFAIALKACTDLGALNHGSSIHTQIIKKGLSESSFVVNTLTTMYTRCGKLNYGFILFERMGMPDVVSWTNMITTYIKMSREEHAVSAFKRMRESYVKPNEYTFAAVISACATISRAEWGIQLHAHIICLGLVDFLSVANSIMTFYSKCGQLASASLIFCGLIRRDIISWSTIISGYSQGGYGHEAFEYLSWMRKEGPKPNEYAFASLLSVCGSMAILEQGRQVHAHVLSIGLERETLMQSALINMYCKCGTLEDASKVFDELEFNDIVSWTAMINGYADHGCSRHAIDLFEKIEGAGLKPDSVTFIGVFSACSHAGLVDLGYCYFRKMICNYRINPSKEHYGCMIDLLCRSGRLSEAEHLIRSMPFQKDDVVWSTLLRACRIHGDVDCGIRASKELLQLDPNSAGTHITLASLHAADGNWKQAAYLRKMMKLKGVMKEPGWSWIKIKGQVNTFVAGDCSHTQSVDMSVILKLLRPTLEFIHEEIGALPDDINDH